MTYVTRYFIQTKPIVQDGSPQPQGEINDFFDSQIFVVLGEPGMGKTTSFEYAAKKETDAEFVRIGEFLSAPQLDHLRDKTLYLDGLDEHRSRANGVDIMDALISRLKVLDCPKVRISCRTAEWRGGKDLGALSAVNNGDPIVQLHIQPLTPDDILKIIPNSEDFVEGARNHNLYEFLNNPQDLFLLHEFYLSKSNWPDNRSELMEGACKALLKELNKEHYEAVDDWVSDKDLTRASDYLAAILMLSGVAGISFDRTTANEVFPSIHEFDGDLFAMKAAVGRHVFKQAEKKRIEPKHRKIAEYMAARYLAARVREGLSLRRVMALMTGIDGGTPSNLRGVYAWLVTMLSGMADHVLVHDPYGAIIYGDSRAWTPSTKKSALTALKEWAKKDPWFRGQERSRPALGGLSDPALVEDFQQLLLEDKCESHLLSTILDAIAGGSKLPEIGDSLLAFVKNSNKPDYLRSSAIEAFAKACPEREIDLVTLLDGIQATAISDKEEYLRGSLLRHLYPKVIGPDRVANYLIKPSGHHIGSYYMFVNYTIFEVTDKNGLRLLAQALQEEDCIFEKDDDYIYRSFISKLIDHLIEKFGHEIIIEELGAWLTLGISKHGSNIFKGDEAKNIRKYLTTNDQVYISLFFDYFNKSSQAEMERDQIWWRFHELVVRVFPPNQFPQMLLVQLEQERNKYKAKALYQLACALVMNTEPTLSSVTIEDLIDVSKREPEFKEILERASQCIIEKWHKKNALQRKNRLEERITRQAKNIENIEPHKVAINEGNEVGILGHYALVWFNRFTDIDHDANPKDRLRQEVGNELAEDIITGFLKALHKPYFNTLEDIAETDARSRTYNRGYLMLAGIDVLAETGKEAVLNLPENILRLAIAYEMSIALDKSAEWPIWLITEKPDFYSRVLDEYWRAQLAAKPESITRFYKFEDDEPRLPIIVQILPGLLRDFPKAHPSILKTMLLNAIRFCPLEKLLPLVNQAIMLRFDRTSGQRTMWISTGFVIAQDNFYPLLKTQLQKIDREKWAALPILMLRILERGEDGKHTVPIRYRKVVIELLGSVFENVHFESNGKGRWLSDQDEQTTANSIRQLIYAFAEDPSDEAASALSDLEKNPALSHWQSDILYTIADQVRTAREAQFTYPDVSRVVSTLSNAGPANVTDLKALVVDALQEIASDIRHGNTDGYKAFWNIGTHSKVTDLHVDENTARDRLLDFLRPKIRHLDIVAEPEVRYADDKRADIAIYSRGMKLPIEIKRDDHPEIWEAAENQLKRQYSRDPASEGNGIYLAFWLDGKGMKKPPKGSKPTNCAEMETALRSMVPESSTGLIEVIVIDASVPDGKRATEKNQLH